MPCSNFIKFQLITVFLGKRDVTWKLWPEIFLESIIQNVIQVSLGIRASEAEM